MCTPRRRATVAPRTTAGRPVAAPITAFPCVLSRPSTMRRGALPKIEAKGGKILVNAVVYRIETGEKNAIEAVHYFDPVKRSQRVTGKIFVIACNGIETPKLLLLSKDERNPNGVANSSDQVGRNMMDQPKLTVILELNEPLWTGVGPVQSSSIVATSQGELPQPLRRRDVSYGELRPQPARRRGCLEKGTGRQGLGYRDSPDFCLYGAAYGRARDTALAGQPD